MSERQEKKRRYNQRLEYIANFHKWIAEEPPMWRFAARRAWKRRRPIWKEEDEA